MTSEAKYLFPEPTGYQCLVPPSPQQWQHEGPVHALGQTNLSLIQSWFIYIQGCHLLFLPKKQLGQVLTHSPTKRDLSCSRGQISPQVSHSTGSSMWGTEVMSGRGPSLVRQRLGHRGQPPCPHWHAPAVWPECPQRLTLHI